MRVFAAELLPNANIPEASKIKGFIHGPYGSLVLFRNSDACGFPLSRIIWCMRVKSSWSDGKRLAASWRQTENDFLIRIIQIERWLCPQRQRSKKSLASSPAS